MPAKPINLVKVCTGNMKLQTVVVSEFHSVSCSKMVEIFLIFWNSKTCKKFLN